ncbi:hypothetical protein GHT06_015315 [Daphnia sinensis]|uniref:Uncharacterized protein n=1 Tax=Daphnia sinensis TaxID=1820382 RepID=A0AAD5PT60_9CRUS|nr:hypothetical protein GHT06_015315 [Daphnia sinensis]
MIVQVSGTSRSHDKAQKKSLRIMDEKRKENGRENCSRRLVLSSVRPVRIRLEMILKDASSANDYRVERYSIRN